MNSPSEAADLRAAALQAERERLAAKRARRGGTTAAAGLRAWQSLGVEPWAINDVRQVLRELVAVTGTTGAVRDCLEAPPGPDLRLAVAELLRPLPVDRGAEFLRDLQNMGLPLVDQQAMPAVELLTQSQLQPGQIEEAQSIDIGPGWLSFVDILAVGSGLQPVDPRSLVERAPLMVVSDYLEIADQEVDPSWWRNRQPEERRYLTARTNPEQLTDSDVELLGWDEEFHRRRLAKGREYSPSADEERIELFELISAAAGGDPSVLDRLEELLPSENASVIRSVRSGAPWPADILADRGLWNLLLHHLLDDGPIDPEGAPFYKWAAFRRAYDLTKTGRFASAWAQTQQFPVGGRPSTPFEKEIQNLRAYLTLMRRDLDETKALDQAQQWLTAMRGDRVVTANLKWIGARRRQRRNERGMVDNPYLVLGVDQGTAGEEWKAAWRALRKRFSNDIDSLSMVNKAKDLIETLERAGSDGLTEIFTVPLDRKRLRPELGKPWRLLVPAASPLPWRRAELAETDLSSLRTAAFTEILDDIK